MQYTKHCIEKVLKIVSKEIVCVRSLLHLRKFEEIRSIRNTWLFAVKGTKERGIKLANHLKAMPSKHKGAALYMNLFHRKGGLWNWSVYFKFELCIFRNNS